jgi:hypothetical protein
MNYPVLEYIPNNFFTMSNNRKPHAHPNNIAYS